MRKVSQEGQQYDVTNRGRVVARIVPAPKRMTDEEFRAFWEEWERQAEETSKYWPKGLTAVEAIREGRDRV